MLPPIERISHLVWSIPVDCSHFPVRYTYAYILANEGGEFVIIDPGFDSDLGERQLSEGIAAAGLTPSKLIGVIVTHFHADHIGAAHRLLRPGRVWFGMHERELAFFPGWPAADKFVEREDRVFAAFGVPPGEDRGAKLTEEQYLAVAPRALPTTTLADRQRIPLAGRHVEVVWTPGHTAGHLCVVDHDFLLLFSGDHVLPRITPNVSAYAHDLGADALGDYLSSLEKIAVYDAYEVCPAHEYRFVGLQERTMQIAEHHRRRSEEVREVLHDRPDATIWEIAQRLTWRRGWASLDGPNMRAALGETMAHVNHLAAQGETLWAS